MQNKKNKPSLCGNYFICTEKPIPWAWRNSFRGIGMPQRFIRMVIYCNE
ncbi:MAG: hypothetical protein KF775_00070 [Cyclobacteriaceae bacterium]|nr:hypothetical protein [Cyclobacteriaceae bacterium]